jgi:hypothetical protein
MAVTMAPPGSPDVTSPLWLTWAQAELELVQVKGALEIGFARASAAEAVSCTVAPPASSVSTEGDRDMAVATWVTVREAVPDADPDEAEMVVVPTATAVPTPPPSTVATPGLELVQLTEAPVMDAPY